MKAEQAKEAYMDCFSIIRRIGARELLRWMEENGSFEAPASSHHHGSYAGGLAVHSVNVYLRLMEIVEGENKRGRKCGYSMETLAVVSLLHDLCKIDAYEQTEEGGYRLTKHFPAGHGEKSVFLILKHMDLMEEEILAIRWHMGQYDFYAKGGGYDLNNAFSQSRLAVMVHLADMMATHFDETEAAQE